MSQASDENALVESAFEAPLSSSFEGGKSSLFSKLRTRLPMVVFWALAAQGVISLSRFLTTMTLGGRFSSGHEGLGRGSLEQLGYYAGAFSALMMIIAVHEAFVTTPLTVFLQSEKRGKRRGLSGNLLLASLGIGLLVVVAGLVLLMARPFLAVANHNIILVVVVVAVLAPFQFLREFSRRWLLATHQVLTSAIFEFLYVLLYLVMLAGLVWFAKISAVATFVIVGIANAVVLTIWYATNRNRFRIKRKEAPAHFARNIGYGKWVAGENVCSVLTMYLGNWLLVPEAAGVFFGCFSIMLLANPFLLGVCSILAPRSAREFTNRGWKGLIQSLANYGAFVLAVLVLVGVVLWFRGEWLTNLLFGDRFIEYFAKHHDGSNPITALLGLALPFLGVSFVLTCGLHAVKRPHYSFFSAVVGLIVLCGGFYLSPEGPTPITAAWSFIAATAANMSARFFFLCKAARETQSQLPSQ